MHYRVTVLWPSGAVQGAYLVSDAEAETVGVELADAGWHYEIAAAPNYCAVCDCEPCACASAERD
jgi:hypothetical protein